MGKTGDNMSGIDTSIRLNDGMSSVLQSMYKEMQHLISGFKDMQNTANTGFNAGAFNGFKQNMAAAISQMGVMEKEAQRAAGIVQKSFDWKKQMNFDVFGGSGAERFKQEADGITIQMQRVIEQQRYIENKALSMRLLPKNAASDIAETSMQLRNLISSMEQLKNVDVNKLSEGQRNKFSDEFEKIRRNIISARQIQDNVGDNIKIDDVSGVNSGFNQIKSIVQQTEAQLRSFKNELNQINGFSWQSMNGPEVFGTRGLERAKQEINSAKSMAEGLIQTQQKLTLKAGKMKMLPPNAISEIQSVNNRIGNIQNTIARLEKEKNKLSRWNVSGINSYNQRIESLRQKMYEAKQAQLEVNNALKNNDVEKLNSAYKRLVNTIDRIDVDIRDNNSAQQQFNNSIAEGNRNASGLVSSIRNIGSQLKMYAGMALGGFGIKSALDITDTYTSLNARLGLITKSQAEAKVLQDKIFESAQRTGTAYTDMANTTAKLGLLAGDAFKNNAELNRFSELMAKSFKISGAGVQEQAAGMYQLTQAMASGRLQGDEFRSIIENAPMLAKAIQDYTGVDTTGLREMSKEGEISADIIKNALFLAGDAIEKKFAEMPKTFSSYFSEIKNTALMEFSGIMQGINSVINTDGFRGFIENVKLSIGGMAEWATIKFYEFRNMFSQLWISAQPAINAICTGFNSIKNYIFSANGVLGRLIKTMTQVVSSTGFIDSIRQIANYFTMAIGGIMFFIQVMSQLITTFDWFGPVLISVIAAIKTYNIVCSKTQGIMRMLNSIISIFTGTTRSATAAVVTETTATRTATIAQNGLNAAIRANPFGLLASAIILVIGLFHDLNEQIDEVNSKTGGPVGGGGIRTKYSQDVKDYAKKHGVSLELAAEAYSEWDTAYGEIKKLQDSRKNFIETMVGKNKYDTYMKVRGGEITTLGKAVGPVMVEKTLLNEMTEKVIKNKNGDYMTLSEYEEVEKAYAASDFLLGTTDKTNQIQLQYEAEIAKKVNEEKQAAADKKEQEERFKKWEDDMQEAIGNMNKGDKPAVGGGGSPAGKTDVGTVDKIKDTVDVTDEDLKFMRDFAERDIINKIQATTLAPQINVSFSGEIKETVDVNDLIGRVTDELANAVNNSARGVHI